MPERQVIKAALPPGNAAAGGKCCVSHRDIAPRAAKSTRSVPSRQGHRRKAQKGFNFVCANLLFVCVDLRFAKPRSFLKKVLIVAVRRCHCGGLIRGLQNLGASCEGVRVVTFCIVQKVTKKHAGLRPATSIQIAGRYEIFAEMSGIHQVTGNAKNNSFPGIAGNDLNRCEVPALQHKEFTQTAKEQPHSLQTVG